MSPSSPDTSALRLRRFDCLRDPTAREVAWSLCWALLAVWTPPPFHAWRRWLLRRFGARIDATAEVYGSTAIVRPENLILEAYSTIGPKARIECHAQVRLGRHAIISQGGWILTSAIDVNQQTTMMIEAPVVIGENAWVAADAYVGPGVTIGEGAVLGAAGVAFADLEAHTVNVGNPVKQVRKRRAPVAVF